MPSILRALTPRHERPASPPDRRPARDIGTATRSAGIAAASTARRLRAAAPVRPAAALALLVAAATAAAGLSLAQPTAANAAASDEPLFLSSFEESDAPAKTSQPEGDQTNVTGSSFGAGSQLGKVGKVTTSGENPPGEVAANLADGASSTKWLTRARTGWVAYELSGATTIDSYTLTSANDTPGRDPKNFTLQGSNDGQTWTDLDTRANQTFRDRFAKNSYTLSAPQTYSRYRLNVTANSGDSLTQLADWDILDSTQPTPPVTPMVTAVGNGPVSGYNIKPNAGFSGLKALRYAGAPIADGATTGQNLLYNVDLTVGADTELSYKILPILDDALTYSATYAAIDLVFADGSRLSQKGLVDGNGFGASAREQGTAKALYASQWNSVKVDLSGLEGQKIDKILFSYDDPNGRAGHGFSGWVDDIALAPKVQVDDSSLVNWVDTRRGTQSSGGFSRGNNIPAAAVPNGFNFFTPMTNANTDSWLYSYLSDNNAANLPRLQGIGISHEPSPWMGDRNQLAVLPSASAVPTSTLTDRQLEFSHGQEIARPDLYSVKFTNGMIAEVTPTDHGGIYRFQFTGSTGSVLLDKVASNSLSGLAVSASGAVTGWVDGGSGLSAGRSRMFVSGQFDKTPTGAGSATGNRSDSARYAAFDTSGADKVVTLRLATSFISQAQATKNLDLEVTGRSFDTVQNDAEQQWNDRLGVIEVEGATDAQKQSLYSNLYRLNLYPNSQFENTGTAAAPKYQYASPVAPKVGEPTATTTNAQVKDGKVYVNNGFWDTYRTVWPAYSLLYPEMEQELVDGFVQQYRDAGWVARWSSPGYADLMTGTSSDVAFADAYLNGALDTKTALEAYDAALKNATVLPTSSAVGRKGLDTSTFLGYTPASTGESVSWGLEGGTNDYGIGRMAAKLADDPATPESRRAQLKEEADYFLARSWSYVNLFDQDADFFQARNADGSWHIPSDEFDPGSWGDAFTESDGWNFAFHAPFDIDGMAALYGGTDGLIAKLDQFFATPEKADKPGGYGGVIHEMLEARDVRMGQLGFSNQVSHHIPYLYAAAGEPSKTQAVVREITQRLFVGSDIGQGYAGDEDNGETSAWFIFSALGFYPEAVGSGEYVIGSPLFDKATVHLANGKDLVVNAPGNSTKNVFVQSASFDGQAIDSAVIPTTTLNQGGTLNLQMGASPSEWGTRTADQGARVPHVDATKPAYGTTTVSESGTTAETDATALVDDNSRSSATFTSATPSIEWTSASGPVQLTSYTLTNGATGSTPTAWTLEGSSDGQTWLKLDERTGEKFAWATQTRPFVLSGDGSGSGSKVDETVAFDHYRLHITATSDGKPATLAEVELLADPAAKASEFRLDAAPSITGTAGVELTSTLATLSGGTSSDAADYTATVDYLDGSGPQAAKLTKSPLGAWQISAPHTFADAGTYSAKITVTEGMQQASATASIAISRDQSLTGAFDSVCIGGDGVTADCDDLDAGFLRAKLAANGFVQGSTVAVPGTDLDFDLPQVEPGQPDNATGRGQTIAVDLGAGATKLSFIGTATEKHLSRDGGTVNFTDGTSAPITIAFGDWTGAATTPQFGNTIVAKSEGRSRGATGTDTAVAAIYATAAYEIPAGKTVASVTLPKEPGSPRPDGRIHVFAIASDGDRAPETAALSVSGEVVGQQVTGVEFTADLATATGGHAGADSTATVNWGDGTATTEGAVTAAAGEAGGARVAGTHRYATAGRYTVTVTVDDGIRSAAGVTTVVVADPVTYTPSIQVPREGAHPGDTVTITGSGFAAGEKVKVTLSSDPAVVVDAIANGSGAISAPVTVPAAADAGSYPVRAIGAVSAVPADGILAVTAKPTTPPEGSCTVSISVEIARPGDTFQVTISGFLAGERVRIILHSDPIVLAEAQANGDGVLTTSVSLPSDVPLGDHTIEVVGLTSGLSASTPLRIAAALPQVDGQAPILPGAYGGLAATGVDGAQPVGALAFGAIGAGVLAVLAGAWIVRRRRGDAGDPTITDSES
ncbi:GH92 family glycosyl hydrolase [Schumannella sp. 10F1B-5-1]|uniref:GH92 family glycosyl hydrolase n=1 Tax=Schumannella sp. 10F1B-5-1 TaxID=2590780 RepID=UPI0011317ED5|nr:GH92 family glycosyl hydrolase [Schumannella sp. 10F1B-5-1]TPW71557.1 ATP-binding protein [Schumannella sp. 10F1B-5-1]